METGPIITIVIPVRDRQQLVTATLDSLAAQTSRPFKVIVVDNGSRDSTVMVVERWIEANAGHGLEVALVNEPRPGAARARNRGLSEVDTPWVMFFDSDDIMRPAHLARVTAGIAAHPEADIIGWDIDVHFLDGSVKTMRSHGADPMTSHLLHTSLSTQRYAAKTALVRSVGGWDDDLRGWDDLALGVRLLSARPVCRRLDSAITVDVYRQADSLTGTGFAGRHDEWETVLDRCQTMLSEAGMERYIRFIDVRRAILAADYTIEGDRRGRWLIDDVTAKAHSRHRRMALRLIYSFVTHRLRGASLLARLLLWNGR